MKRELLVIGLLTTLATIHAPAVAQEPPIIADKPAPVVVTKAPVKVARFAKVKHIVKKAIMFPVYTIGGGIVGVVGGGVLWYHVGGYESNIAQGLSNINAALNASRK